MDLTGADGSSAARYVYDAFGGRLEALGPLADVNPYQFSSKEREIRTGLYYYGLRYYNSSVARWLSRDPLEEAGGLNLYGFVNNSPNDFYDLLGGRPKRSNSSWSVKGLISKLRIVGALPFDVLSGDFRSVDPTASLEQGECDALITVNGIWNNEQKRARLSLLVAQTPRYLGAVAMLSENHTSLYVGDVLQIIGDEIGMIQVSSRRLARHITSVFEQMEGNGCTCPRIQVFAHSQGAMIFKRALPLLDEKVRASIYYTGVGGQTTIQGDHGLASAENYASKTDWLKRDWVPVIGNYNPLRIFSWIRDGAPDYREFTQSHANRLEHSYEPYYHEYVSKLEPN
jgi:RHS repeat-associated protein